MPILGVIASSIYKSSFTPTGSYDALAVYTVPAGGASSVEFAGIPQSGYQHLQIRYISRADGASLSGNGYIRINNDTGSNYSCHLLWGNGSSPIAGAYPNSTFIYTDALPRGATTSGIFATGIIDILDYTSTTKNKTVKILSGNEVNGQYTNYMGLTSGVWLNTNTVNSITFFPDVGNFAQYSQFALYGIRG